MASLTTQHKQKGITLLAYRARCIISFVSRTSLSLLLMYLSLLLLKFQFVGICVKEKLVKIQPHTRNHGNIHLVICDKTIKCDKYTLILVKHLSMAAVVIAPLTTSIATATIFRICVNQPKEEKGLPD